MSTDNPLWTTRPISSTPAADPTVTDPARPVGNSRWWLSLLALVLLAEQAASVNMMAPALPSIAAEFRATRLSC